MRQFARALCTTAIVIMVFLGTGCVRMTSPGMSPLAGKLGGVWQMRSQRGWQVGMVVYPLKRRRYLIQVVPFRLDKPFISCFLFRARFRCVGGRMYLACRCLLPNLVGGTDNIGDLRREMQASNRAKKAYFRSIIRSIRTTGIGRVYFALRVVTIAPGAIELAPCAASGALHLDGLPAITFDSRSSLLASLDHSQSQAPERRIPLLIFVRSSSKKALPIGFYLDR